MTIERHNERPDIGKLDATCNRTGCSNPSKWQVGLMFFAAGHTREHQGIRAEMRLVLCAEHGKAAKVEDFLSDAGWEQIKAGVLASGKVAPERGLTKLMLMPIPFGGLN